MLSELKIQGSKAIVSQLDNTSAINVVNKLVLHDRSKHIKVIFHFLTDQVNHGKLEVKHSPSAS